MSQHQDAAASQPVTKKSCQFCGFERSNADLLNAAPELLAALKIAQMYLPVVPADKIDRDTITQIRAAIARAEGRS